MNKNLAMNTFFVILNHNDIKEYNNLYTFILKLVI